MTAADQVRVLKRIDDLLLQALASVGQLPACEPLRASLAHAERIASAWLSDQRAEIGGQS